MGKIVIEQFKVKISVIIGWKLNGCNMLCTTTLCGLSLGLVSVGVQAVRWYFTHWETVIFIYHRIAKYICCFINLNQLYVEYICFVWFEYFRVCSNISRIVSEYSIVLHVLDEILKCLEKYDLTSWHSKAIFTGQAHRA